MKTKEIKKTGNSHLDAKGRRRGHRPAVLIPCPWVIYGCRKVLKTGDLLRHLTRCSANPRNVNSIKIDTEIADRVNSLLAARDSAPSQS